MMPTMIREGRELLNDLELLEGEVDGRRENGKATTHEYRTERAGRFSLRMSEDECTTANADERLACIADVARAYGVLQEEEAQAEHQMAMPTLLDEVLDEFLPGPDYIEERRLGRGGWEEPWRRWWRDDHFFRNGHRSARCSGLLFAKFFARHAVVQRAAVDDDHRRCYRRLGMNGLGSLGGDSREQGRNDNVCVKAAEQGSRAGAGGASLAGWSPGWPVRQALHQLLHLQAHQMLSPSGPFILADVDDQQNEQRDGISASRTDKTFHAVKMRLGKRNGRKPSTRRGASGALFPGVSS